MKYAQEYCYFLLDGMLESTAPIYTPGWRETKWGKVLCLRKKRDGRGLNRGPTGPEFEELTARLYTPSLKKSMWNAG